MDHRSDIYSMGAVLYEILAGREMIQGDSIDALLDQAVNFDPPPPSIRDPSPAPVF